MWTGMLSPSAFDPMEYLALARELAISTREARLRATTSRAYYTLFLIIRDWLGVEGQQNVHFRVRQELGRISQQGMGARLHRLSRLREAADYQRVPTDVALRDWDQNWKKADETAEWLLSRLRQLGVIPKTGPA